MIWHVDIVVDLAWFSSCKGKLGEPRSRARQPIPDHDFDNEFLLYGDDEAVRHLRVLLHTDSQEAPQDVVNANVHRWTNLLEVATGMAAPETVSTASLGPNTTGMLVVLGQGGEEADAVQLAPRFAPPATVDYAAVAQIMIGWKPDFRSHLFYLGRFLNHRLPVEVRWLNGYRVLEWHFRRGTAGLSRDAAYRAFVEANGQAFDALLAPGQDRKGLIEEVRALVAHAMLTRTADPRSEGGSTNLITRTFGPLESLVIAAINSGAVEGVRFATKPTPQILPAPS